MGFRYRFDYNFAVFSASAVFSGKTMRRGLYLVKGKGSELSIKNNTDRH